MEHGSAQDRRNATFSFVDEDHTLANSLESAAEFVSRCEEMVLGPRVSFCGYSIPHPSNARVNIRVQTTGDEAREVLKDACQNLMLMCQHVRSTFESAVGDFKEKNPKSEDEMETDEQ